MGYQSGQKSIFITGGASGLGREVGRYFAGKGWFVGIADINGEEAAVLQVPKTTFGDGYGFPSGIGVHDSWTLIMDIYVIEHDRTINSDIVY